MWTIAAPAAAHRLASAATSAGVQGTLGFCSRPRALLRQALIMILSICLPLIQAQIPLRVLTQDAALGPVRQVVPLADRRDRPGKHCVPVRVVRCVDDFVVADA